MTFIFNIFGANVYNELNSSKLGTCLFPYFIRFLLIIDYWSLRMESCTNSYYFA